MKPRKLIVLDINDLPGHDISSKITTPYLDFVSIDSWKMLQKTLVSQEPISPDILLLDISFDKDSSLMNAKVLGQEIVPYGPILALPFLMMNRIMSFSIYSGHLDNPFLKTYPPFLIPFGLIAAKITGKVFSSNSLSPNPTDNDLSLYLSELLNKFNAINSGQALKIALKLYRDNLINRFENEKVFLLNSNDLLENLYELERQALDRKLTDIDEKISLVLQHPDGNTDSISVFSLFSDIVSWNAKLISHESVGHIIQYFEPILHYDFSFQAAAKVIKIQNIKEKETDFRPRADVVLKDEFPLLTSQERREVFDIIVFLANIHSWAINSGRSFLRKDVYHRMGAKVSQLQYISWFGARGSASNVGK